ncbi:hypothetical protein ACGFNY_44090 [Streptomyces chartreusis]|uniref:hypothetical protein n=1 Tax=Streptomyces chartreusis TaxID=1969 RepID=UPI00370FCB8F
MTATPETTRTDTHHHFLTGLAQQGRYAHEFARAGQVTDAVEHLDAIGRLTVAYRAAVDGESLERGRKQLLEAMSAVSEDRTCCGWASDWARTLHAEAGIWETLGRSVGWPTGNYDQWVWVSWDEAAALYAGSSE